MRAWREIRASRRDVVTTNLVVIESHALIARRGGVEAGLRFWDVRDAFAFDEDFVRVGFRLVG